jgi:hypothetical protein
MKYRMAFELIAARYRREESDAGPACAFRSHEGVPPRTPSVAGGPRERRSFMPYIQRMGPKT